MLRRFLNSQKKRRSRTLYCMEAAGCSVRSRRMCGTCWKRSPAGTMRSRPTFRRPATRCWKYRNTIIYLVIATML